MSSGSFCSRGFTWAQTVVVGFIRFHGGSLRRNFGSSRSFWFAWFNSCAKWGLRVQPSSPRFPRARFGVVAFIQVRVDYLGRA